MAEGEGKEVYFYLWGSARPSLLPTTSFLPFALSPPVAPSLPYRLFPLLLSLSKEKKKTFSKRTSAGGAAVRRLKREEEEEEERSSRVRACLLLLLLVFAFCLYNFGLGGKKAKKEQEER